MEKQPKRIITHWLLQVCQAYFLADLIWVAKVPICVKSPNVIIKVSLWHMPDARRLLPILRVKSFNICSIFVLPQILANHSKTYVAPLRCNDLFICTSIVCQISLVLGRRAFGWNQYIFLNSTSRFIQGKSTRAEVKSYYYRNSIRIILYFLDCYSLYCISWCLGFLPNTRLRCIPHWRSCIWNAFHSAPFCTMCIKFEVDIWPLQTDCQKMAEQQRNPRRCIKWIVRNSRLILYLEYLLMICGRFTSSCTYGRRIRMLWRVFVGFWRLGMWRYD